MIQDLILKIIFSAVWLMMFMVIINLVTYTHGQRLFVFKKKSSFLGFFFNSYFKIRLKDYQNQTDVKINIYQLLISCSYIGLIAGAVLSIPVVEFEGSVFPRFGPDRIYLSTFLVTVSILLRNMILYSNEGERETLKAFGQFKRETSFLVILWLCVLASGIYYGASSFERVIKIQQGLGFAFLPKWGVFSQPFGAAAMFSLLIIRRNALFNFNFNPLNLDYNGLPYKTSLILGLADKILLTTLLIIFINLYFGAGNLPQGFIDQTELTGYTQLMMNIFVFSLKFVILFFVIGYLGTFLKKRSASGETKNMWKKTSLLALINIVYIFYYLVKKDFGL